MRGAIVISTSPHIAVQFPRAPLALAAVALCFASCGCQIASQGQNSEGVQYYQAGNYTSALQKFEQARGTSPSDPDSYYNMAATYHQLAKQQKNPDYYKQAESLYNQCLDLDSDHVDCHRGLAVLLVETNRQDAAFRLVKNWAMDNPQSSDARVELARLYQEFGDTPTAQLHLQTALQIDQQNPRAWAAMGYLREQSGDLAQALDNYKRSYDLNKMQPAVEGRIASLTQSVGSSGTAVPPGGTQTVTPNLPVMRY
jgi:Tfp pilus assembly protein PilF